jgi:hypothetical protein
MTRKSIDNAAAAVTKTNACLWSPTRGLGVRKHVCENCFTTASFSPFYDSNRSIVDTALAHPLLNWQAMVSRILIIFALFFGALQDTLAACLPSRTTASIGVGRQALTTKIIS